MRQGRNLLSICVWAGLTACSAQTVGSSEQSAVARNFDLLAREVASCADARATCTHDAIETKARDACQTAYEACRARAGADAEDALAHAISDCQARANDCKPSESSAPAHDPCEASLRDCIGEASGGTSGLAMRDASVPSARAPTYQCFGQLRVCAGDATGPKQCAAEARACVLAAVEPPAPRKLP